MTTIHTHTHIPHTYKHTHTHTHTHQINNNGVVSFTTTVGTYTPGTFPLEGPLELIAPFWADVDTRGTGTVWYRETASQELLERAASEIHNGFVDQGSFFPSYLIIATWDHVGYFNSRVDKVSVYSSIPIVVCVLSHGTC